MNRKLLIIVPILILLLIVSLYGCKRPEETDPNAIRVTGIELDKEMEVLLLDGTLTLNATIMPENATNKTVEWTTSFNEVAEVSNEGVITAKGTGIVTVSATSEDGDFTANATIYIGDAIVGTDYTDETAGYNTSRFSTIAAAVTAKDEESVILITAGDYNEELTFDKSVSLIGIEYPVIKSITMNADDKVLSIRGIQFRNTDYPTGGAATVKGSIDGELHIVDCKFNIDSEEDRAGGYAIYASAGTSKLTVKSCVIDNYRYGIYAHRAGANYDVTNNTFTNLNYGIGVDIRVPNSNPAVNYPAMGEINDNTFVDVVTRSEFLFNGDDYDGNLDFSDFTPIIE